MKNRIIPILSAAMALTAVAWSAIAISTEEPSTAEKNETRDRVALMDRKQAEISKRVGMSSCLEISDAGGEDFVATALEKGLIVEATLEEVEAALKAAAATPQREDDLAAMNLAHWGSYRFFVDEKAGAPAPSQ